MFANTVRDASILNSPTPTTAHQLSSFENVAPDGEMNLSMEEPTIQAPSDAMPGEWASHLRVRVLGCWGCWGCWGAGFAKCPRARARMPPLPSYD